MPGYRYGSGGGGVGTLAAQKAAAQKDKKKQSPGVVTRLFDVLSRGNFAVANAVSREHDADNGKAGTFNAGAFGKGFWEGLSGKRKTTFDDVLAQKGMNGGWQRATLGFGLDVLTDPTSYLGVGIGKAAATGTAKVAGKGLLKAGEEVAEHGAAKAAAKGLGKKAAERTYVSSGAKAIQEAQRLEKAAQAATPVVKAGSVAQKLVKPTEEIVASADKLQEMASEALRASKAAAGKSKDDLEELASDLLRRSKEVGKATPTTAAPTTKAATQFTERELKDMGNLGALVKAEGETAAKGAQTVLGAADNAAATVAPAATKALPGAATGRALELRVLGKPIIRSERAYEGAAKVLRPIGNSQVGSLVGRTFRTGHGLPQGIRNIERKSQGVGMQDLHDKLLDIKLTFSHTTKAQRREIASAIDRGAIDSLDDSLRPLAEYAQRNIDSLNPTEGLGKAKTKVEADTLAALPSKSDDIADRLAKEYDKHITKQAYKSFRTEVDQKFAHLVNDPEIRRALDRTEKVFQPMSREGREWTNMFDKVQGYWKMAVTAPNPGFHIRNMMGDSYLNYLDGVVNPEVYRKSSSIVFGKGKINLRVGDRVITGDDIMALYRREGLHSKFAQTENLVGGTSSRVLDTIGELSNKREDFGRLAHFIDALGKEAKHGRNFDDAVEAAAERVRKFNIDYSDMTDMEKKFKRVIPFYTFARKALPVQLEMVFTRPGRVAVLPKGKQAIERMLGVREAGDESPLPGIDENLPPWMRDYFNISMGNNRVRSPDLPIDLLGQYANPVKGVLSGVSPFIKGPIELGTGKTVPEGFKQKASIPRYLLNQTPISRQVANYVWKDDDAPEKSLRWAVGPLASKLVAAPPTTAKKGGSKSKSTTKSGGGNYRYGSK